MLNNNPNNNIRSDRAENLLSKGLPETVLHAESSKAALEEALFFKRKLLNTAGALIIVTDKNGIITLFNEEAVIKLGYSRAEVLNKMTPVIFHRKNEIAQKRKELRNQYGINVKNNFDVLVEKARRDIHEEEQCSYIRKDGASFPVSLTITALRDISGNITGYMGVAIDISKRIKAEEELKKVQRLFLNLLHNYPDGAISIIDRKFCFVYTGGELHKQLYSDVDELIGKEMYPRFPESLRSIISEVLEKVFKEKILVTAFELPFQIAGHTYIMDAFPLVEEDGVISYVGVIIKNISKLKKAEEGLREALRKEKELGELKSRFVSMASHEFRTPLSTVLSSAYLIEKYIDAEDQPKREKHLQRIVASVTMLTDILDEFLNIGKIEEGKLQAKFTEFNVEEMILTALDEIKNNVKTGQYIKYEHDGTHNVHLDKSLLKHIVLNLISNAIKFSPERSGIEIRTINKEDQLILSVKDKGIGISSEDQKHLMERFFRGSNAANIQGTGLGLHIISKYAEMMGGHIICKSRVEKGTEFIVTFNNKKNQHEKDIIDRRQ